MKHTTYENMTTHLPPLIVLFVVVLVLFLASLAGCAAATSHTICEENLTAARILIDDIWQENLDLKFRISIYRTKVKRLQEDTYYGMAPVAPATP